MRSQTSLVDSKEITSDYNIPDINLTRKENQSSYIQFSNFNFLQTKSEETSPVLEESEKEGTILIKDENYYKLNFLNPIVGSDQDRFGKKDWFESLQKFEGYVEEVFGRSSFTAVVRHINNECEDGFVEFDFDDVTPNDWNLIKVGAIFYWNIGFQHSNGVRTKSSLIRFRRLPKWSRKKIESLKVSKSHIF
jgi:hypothetical protein